MIKPSPYTLFRQQRCVEPIKRRHGSTKPQWQVHRFEIKNGITLRDAMIFDMLHQHNPLRDLLKYE